MGASGFPLEIRNPTFALKTNRPVWKSVKWVIVLQKNRSVGSRNRPRGVDYSSGKLCRLTSQNFFSFPSTLHNHSRKKRAGRALKREVLMRLKVEEKSVCYEQESHKSSWWKEQRKWGRRGYARWDVHVILFQIFITKSADYNSVVDSINK